MLPYELVKNKIVWIFEICDPYYDWISIALAIRSRDGLRDWNHLLWQHVDVIFTRRIPTKESDRGENCANLHCHLQPTLKIEFSAVGCLIYMPFLVSLSALEPGDCTPVLNLAVLSTAVAFPTPIPRRPHREPTIIIRLQVSQTEGKLSNGSLAYCFDLLQGVNRESACQVKAGISQILTYSHLSQYEKKAIDGAIHV